MRISILLLFSFLVSSSAFAQETPDSAQIKMIAHMTHWGASSLYGEDDATYSVDEDWAAPWKAKSYTATEARANARHVLDHALLRYGKDKMFNKMKMRFLSTFAPGFEGEPDNSELDIVSSELTDSLGNKIEAKGMNVNYSFSFTDGNEAEGMGHNSKGKKITADARLNPKPIGPVTGSITYAAMSLIRYEHVDISAVDVGKQFSLGDLTFTVRQFSKDRIVFAHNNPSPGIQTTQFNAAGEPIKRKSNKFGSSNANLFDFMYEAFEQNPGMTKEELEAIMFANISVFEQEQEDLEIRTVYRRSEGAEKITVFRPILSEPVEKTVTVE